MNVVDMMVMNVCVSAQYGEIKLQKNSVTDSRVCTVPT